MEDDWPSAVTPDKATAVPTDDRALLLRPRPMTVRGTVVPLVIGILAPPSFIALLVLSITGMIPSATKELVPGAWVFAVGTFGSLGIFWLSVHDFRKAIRARRASLAQLRATGLPERAKHAAQVLQEATTLVEELQAELTARTALLEDIQRQVAQGTERAADMAKLSAVDEETTRVLNKYFDEALKHRLADLEHSARGREWLIGTVVAVAVSVIAILFAHFVLGF